MAGSEDYAKDQQVAKQVYLDVCAELRPPKKLSFTGVQVVLPPEKQLQSTVVERLSQKLSGGDGTEVQRAEQLYHKIHTTNLAQTLATSSLPPSATNALMKSYRDMLGLDEQLDRVCPAPANTKREVGKTLALRTAVLKRRDYLSDTEAQAIMEISSKEYSRMRWNHLMGLGVTTYLCWRGRHKFRFPFWTPTRNFSADSPSRRLLIHGVRWLSYFGMYLTVGPAVITQLYSTACGVSMAADPRLDDLKAYRPDENAIINFDQVQQHANTRSGQLIKQRTFPPQQAEEANSGYGGAAQWPQQASRTPTTEPRSKDNFDESPLDMDVDNASPRAWPSKDEQPSANAPGAAWARLRKQAGHEPAQAQGQQRQRPSQPSESSWGESSDGEISPEYRGPRESYSFPRADEEKEEGKSQAQKEFDELLERERSGANQEQTSWNRK